MSTYSDQNQTFPPFSSHSFPPLTQHLNLDVFKVLPCQNQLPHSNNKCPYYHNQNDMRRSSNIYSSQLCEQGTECLSQGQCPKCHSKTELLYHPDNYKTQFCRAYFEKNQCKMDIFCPFAHFEDEIQIELLHQMKPDIDFFLFYYKTVVCPFYWKKHDTEKCVYAHGSADFRRNPHLFFYEPNECFYYTENILCPYGNYCKNAHSTKEIEFHPIKYKTRICNQTFCKNRETCSFAHDRKDYRFF